MVLFITLYKVVPTFEPVKEHPRLSVAIQMKATEQYFPVELFQYYTVQGGSNF